MQTDLESVLSQIESRVNAATPGPWEVLATVPQKVGMVNPPPGGGFVAQVGYPPIGERGDNVIFIAAARSDVPALVKALRRAVRFINNVDIGCYECPSDAEDEVAQLLRESAKEKK